jgi:hypothetical protein
MYTGENRDTFMESMIKNYALEKKNSDGSSSFYFKAPQAKFAAYEIVDTHLGLKGKAAEEYLNQYFNKTWRHFDTAGDGIIEAERMGGFFRFLCGNM